MQPGVQNRLIVPREVRAIRIPIPPAPSPPAIHSPDRIRVGLSEGQRRSVGSPRVCGLCQRPSPPEEISVALTLPFLIVHPRKIQDPGHGFDRLLCIRVPPHLIEAWVHQLDVLEIIVHNKRVPPPYTSTENG